MIVFNLKTHSDQFQPLVQPTAHPPAQRDMGRFKQRYRHATGGKAPRKQLGRSVAFRTNPNLNAIQKAALEAQLIQADQEAEQKAKERARKEADIARKDDLNKPLFAQLRAIDAERYAQLQPLLDSRHDAVAQLKESIKEEREMIRAQQKAAEDSLRELHKAINKLFQQKKDMETDTLFQSHTTTICAQLKEFDRVLEAKKSVVYVELRKVNDAISTGCFTCCVCTTEEVPNTASNANVAALLCPRCADKVDKKAKCCSFCYGSSSSLYGEDEDEEDEGTNTKCWTCKAELGCSGECSYSPMRKECEGEACHKFFCASCSRVELSQPNCNCGKMCDDCYEGHDVIACAPEMQRRYNGCDY